MMHLPTLKPMTFFERAVSAIREAAGVLKQRFDGLWGYDVFIAYRRSDAYNYAEGLHQQILAEHLDCFIDTKVYVPGDSLLNETRRQVAKSTVLVLIASPAINDVRELDWIEAELDAYLAAHSKDAKVVIADMGGTFASARPSIVTKLRPFLRIPQPIQALSLQPSSEVLDAIRKQLAGRRRDRIRIRWFQGIATALLALSVGLGILTYITLQLRRNSEERLRTTQIAESRFAAEKALEEQDPELAAKTVLQGAPLYRGERPVEESNWKALVEVESRRPALRIIRGLHDAPRISWDPDGKRIATLDGTQLAVWDASTGRQIFAAIHRGYEVGWSPDGTLLATNSGTLMSASDGHVIAQVGEKFRHIIWAPHSPRLLGIVGDTVRIFEAPAGKEISALPIDGSVQDAIWNSAGTEVLATTADAVVHVCDAESGKEVISWALNETAKRAVYRAIDWSMDGKLVATAFENKIIIWDAVEGKKITEIAGEYVQRVRFSADGSFLMVAGYNGVSLNDSRTGRILKSIPVKAEDAELSRDNRLIGIASNGGVYEWEWARDRRRWLRYNTLAYRRVAWSPDSLHLAATADYSLLIRNKDQRTSPELDLFTTTTGWEIPAYTTAAVPDPDRNRETPQRVVVSLSRDGRALDIYDLVARRRLLSLSSEGQKVQTWVWSQDSTRLAVFFENGTIKLWSAVDGSEFMMRDSHRDVTSAWLFDKWMITRSKDNSEKLWRIDDRMVMASYRKPNDAFSTVFWNSDQTLVLVRPDGEAPTIWDIRTGKKISALKTTDLALQKVFWSPSDSQLVSVPPEGPATVWNVATGAAILTWPMKKQNLGLSWSPDGERIVTIDERNANACALRDARTGKELAHFDSCWSVNWSSDSRRALIGCEENGFYLDAATGKALNELKSKQGVLGWEAAWDPTGSRVVVTFAADNFYVLESESGSIFRSFSIPEPWIVRAVWDRKGQRVTVFSGDRIVSAFGVARVFDLLSGQEIAILQGHEKNILGGSWDTSGTRLLTWSQDTTARIWDIAKSRETALLSGHSDFVQSGEWSNDDRRVTVRYLAPPPYTWDVGPFELDQYARADWLRASLAISEVRESFEYRSAKPSRDSTAAVACQKGAEDPVDPARRGPGVRMEEIKPYALVPVCEQAIAEAPESGRLNYLFGRAKLSDHDLQKAYAAFEKAASKGYVVASIRLGEMMLDPSDLDHYAPQRGLELLENAGKISALAYVVMARFFESSDSDRTAAYLNKAIAARESHAYRLLAEQAEERAQAAKDPTAADEQWLEAFRNWSIAYNLSQYIEKRGAADWEIPLARRANIAWHLAERGRTTDVVKAYRDSVASASIRS
jgi:WD40 repeat protein